MNIFQMFAFVRNMQTNLQTSIKKNSAINEDTAFSNKLKSYQEFWENITAWEDKWGVREKALAINSRLDQQGVPLDSPKKKNCYFSLSNE